MPLPRRRSPTRRRRQRPARRPSRLGAPAGLAAPRAGDLGRSRRRGHQHPGGLAAARLGHGRHAPRAGPALPGESRHRPRPRHRLPEHRLVRAAGHQGRRRGDPARAARSPCWPWSATAGPSRPPRPAGSASWNHRSARWSASRSSRLSGWPTTRPPCHCPARRAGPWPRSRPRPAARSPSHPTRWRPDDARSLPSPSTTPARWPGLAAACRAGSR